MAFFSSKKKTTDKQKSIRPLVLKTENVAKELLSIASVNKVDVSSLDFNLLEMQTYVRKKSPSKDEMFKEISEQELKELKNSNSLLDQNFEIKQSYEVEIFTKKPRPAYDGFIFSVGANATMCKVFLTIKQGSHVAYNENFKHDFLDLINKKKIRANILVGLFDEMVDDVVSKIYATLRVNESITYEKNDTLLVAQGIEPQATIDDDLIMHFKEKKQDDTSDKVDYSKRNFILSVVKDELLIEYIKPKKGTAGRNCRGEYLAPKEPSVKNQPTFKVSDKIAVIETPETTEYRAKENGYIVFENETYDIKDELDINEISFKTTGSIETKLDAEVSLKVKEADVFKDAVGMGMEVEISEIEVEGNIGPKARLNAKKAKIDGQTHQSSYVNADELTINVHKGEAHGNNVHITRLEQGSVVANKVDISQAIGGNVKAKEVVIDLLGSNATIVASHSIEIKRMHGSENRFIIDPLAAGAADVDVSEKEKELDELEIKIRFLKKEIEKYSAIIQNNEKSFLELKKKLMHYKKNSIKMPEAFVKQYKQFQKLQLHLEELKSELEEQKANRERLNISINAVQDNIFNARVINRDRWAGYNEIKFKLIDPPMDVVFSPREGSLDKIFALVKTDDDEYVIKAVKE